MSRYNKKKGCHATSVLFCYIRIYPISVKAIIKPHHPPCSNDGAGLLGFLYLYRSFHDELSLIMVALGTHPVRKHICAAAGTRTEVGRSYRLMRSSHPGFSLRLSSLWNCHDSTPVILSFSQSVQMYMHPRITSRNISIFIRERHQKEPLFGPAGKD